MKYIIEIKPEYEDKFKGVMILGAENSNLYVDSNTVDELEVLNSDYINEHFGDLQDTAYQKGFEDGQAVNDKGCEGCKYRGTIGMPPCIHCCNNFPNAWKKQDDKPIIGEVVERYLNGKRDGVGMFLGEDGDYWNCLFWTGAIFGTFAYPSNQFKRTGNVCDIEKILEAMEA